MPKVLKFKFRKRLTELTTEHWLSWKRVCEFYCNRPAHQHLDVDTAIFQLPLCLYQFQEKKAHRGHEAHEKTGGSLLSEGECFTEQLYVHFQGLLPQTCNIHTHTYSYCLFDASLFLKSMWLGFPHR